MKGMEQWAQLEPERCDGNGFVSLEPGGDLFGVGLPGVVLAAVIAAIEARGWFWRVQREGGSSHGWYSATVNDVTCNCEVDEPAFKPLLIAYLSAVSGLEVDA